ncbi:MAG: carboxypeptidase regulatory-like domain-containing protein, partial [Candidatus Hydrogenedentes bacterium]|nr:carboxypeptidase regulatory-like domain-containing protein [Candidatus Hydrogenedentota bacterium]
MNVAALLITATLAAADLSTVAGRVVDERGRPVAGARVFLEQGLGGSVQVTRAAPDGSYRFENVLPGLTGVFARAQGYAFGGRSVRVAIADTLDDTDVTLREAGTLSGTVLGPGGAPVSGARITRALFLGEMSVSIPFAKLARFGINEPRTDEKGRFSILSLPRGEPVALKIAHPRYAQEAATGFKVGDRNVKITLSRGVLISGNVIAQGSETLVPNATVFFRNPDPPNDTVIARAGADGSFSLRLKPGAYVYDASGANFRSPNLRRMVVTGQYEAQRVALYVAGTSSLRGLVKDADSGEPVPGARLVLESYGVPSAITRTGPTGEFEFNAAEGENVVILDAAPGYILPAKPALRVQVAANRPVEVPTYWIAPIPKYSLEVIDEDEQPVAGAVVRVLRPAQFGWRKTDANGYVDLSFASLPPDGTVVGFVEHPTRAEGALFAITRDRSEDAIVQLQPLARVEGTVRSAKGIGLAGVAVESRFTAESFPETIALWRTITASGGAFAWDGVPRHAPQLCVATARDKEGRLFEGDSGAFIVADESPFQLEDIVVEGGTGARSSLGRRLKWYDNKLLCGSLPDRKARRAPAV